MEATALELSAQDGRILRGLRWARGVCWLVLLHEAGRDLDAFVPLHARLAEHEISALALDRRGHGGSEGTPDPAAEREDVRTAVRAAREAGAECVIVVAARDAALPALAAVEDDPPDGYVLLSPATPAPEELPSLRGAGRAKLLLTGRDALGSDEAASALQRVSIGWALKISLPSERVGTDLLVGEVALHAGEQLVRFAAETCWLTSGVAGVAAVTTPA